MGDGLKRVHEAKNLAFLLHQLLFLVAVLHHHVESMCNRAPLLLGGWVRVRDQRSGGRERERERSLWLLPLGLDTQDKRFRVQGLGFRV
jgi:hypothetical protein